MADYRYPAGAPVDTNPTDPTPYGPITTPYGSQSQADAELQRQQAGIMRFRDLFAPPPEAGVTPQIVPRGLYRRAQADDIMAQADALAIKHDSLDMAFNASVDAAKAEVSHFSTVNDVISPVKRMYGAQAAQLYLDSVTTSNIDAETMSLRARLANDPGIGALGPVGSDGFLARLNDINKAKHGVGLTDSSGLVSGSNMMSRLSGVAVEGKAFIGALVQNTIAGVSVLGHMAGLSDADTGGYSGSFDAARTQAASDWEDLYHRMPRVAQLAIDEINPLNIAMAIGTAGGSAAIEGMGFKGSSLLASFIKPQNFFRMAAGNVAARDIYENTDGKPLGVRLVASGAGAVLASSPDSILRFVNNLDDLRTLMHVAGPTETSTYGVTAIPDFGLREAWPKFWVPIRGGAITAPTPKVPSLVVPSKATQDLFDLHPIQAGLSAVEAMANKMRRAVGERFQWFEDDMFSTPAMEERARVNRRIESQAIAISHPVDAKIRSAFNFDDKGRILDLVGKVPEFPDGPTFADMAAKYPLFEPYLSSFQRGAVDDVRTRLQPLAQVYESLGHKADAAESIIDGGFHFPRGRALEDGVVVADRAGGSGMNSGSRATVERAQKFPTQIAGIDAGYTYDTMRSAVADYVSEVGQRALQAHINNYLTSLTDPVTGEKLAQVAADRMPGIKDVVSTLRDKIATRRTTVQRRSAVQTVAEQAATRAENMGDRALTRAANAESRMTAIGSISSEDIAQAHADVTRSITEGRWIANETGQDLQRTLRAKGVLSATERELQGHVDSLNEQLALADHMISEAGLPKFNETTGDVITSSGASEKAWQLVDRQHRVIDGIQRRIDQMTDLAEKQANTVDELINKGDINGNLADANRAELVQNRQIERNAVYHERQFALAKREVQLLDRELTRRANEAAAAGERADAAALRTQQSQKEIQGYTDQLNGLMSQYKRAQDNAASLGVNRDRINLPGLQAYDFPVHVANAVNKVINNEGGIVGRDASIPRMLLAYNSLYRGARATLDDSVLGVQGLLGMADDPQAARDAIRMNAHAWNSEEALGEYIGHFDTNTQANGRLSASRWASQDLSLSSGAGEFNLTGGGIENATLGGLMERLHMGAVADRLPDRLVNGAPVRAANRVFGYTATAERLKWADSELETVMQQTGKTAEELVQDGTVAKIAQSVNRLTGVADQRFLGNPGDWVFFASRYLESRIETVVRATAGGAQYAAHAASLGAIAGPGIENKMAVRSLGKLITYGSTLTFLANEALGNETDTQLIKNGNYNSNFMTVRVGNHDWSLFGPYSSLLRLIVQTGLAAKDIATGDPTEGLGKAGGAYLGVASGLVSEAYGLLTGQDAVGHPTGSPGLLGSRPLNLYLLAGTLASSVVPFGAPGTVTSLAQAAIEGVKLNPGGVASELLASAGTVAGAKVGDVTPAEHLQMARDDSVRKATFTNPADGSQIHAHSLHELSDQVGTKLAAFLADSADDTGKIGPLKQERITALEQAAASGDKQAAAMLVGITTQRRLAAVAAEHTVNGVIDGKAYRDARTNIINQQVGESAVYQSEIRQMAQSANPIDRAVAGWYDLLNQSKSGESGLVDFQTFNGLEDAYFNKIGPDMAAKVQATVALSPQGASPAESDLRNVRDQLNKAGYFELRDKAWQQVTSSIKDNAFSNVKDPAIRAYVDSMRTAPTPEAARKIATAFWENAYIKEGYSPDTALPTAIANLSKNDEFLKAFDQVKNAEIIKWGDAHKDLVNPATKWGYIAPDATGVSPLAAPPAAPPRRSMNIEPVTTERLVQEFKAGSSYGQLGIKYGMESAAVRSRIRNAAKDQTPLQMRGEV